VDKSEHSYRLNSLNWPRPLLSSFRLRLVDGTIMITCWYDGNVVS
jgi:hypothetical protein